MGHGLRGGQAAHWKEMWFSPPQGALHAGRRPHCPALAHLPDTEPTGQPHALKPRSGWKTVQGWILKMREKSMQNPP